MKFVKKPRTVKRPNKPFKVRMNDLFSFGVFYLLSSLSLDVGHILQLSDCVVSQRNSRWWCFLFQQAGLGAPRSLNNPPGRLWSFASQQWQAAAACQTAAFSAPGSLECAQTAYGCSAPQTPAEDERKDDSNERRWGLPTVCMYVCHFGDLSV